MNRKELFQDQEEASKLFLKFLNKTEESLEKDIDTIEEWIKSQPHLPEITSRHRISNFLKMNKCSIELTKKKIDMYYTYRSFMPDVFQNTHPKLPHMQDVANKLYAVPLPKLTKDGNAVSVFRLKAYKLDDIPNYFHCLAHSLNIAEIRLAEEISLRDIFIFDCDGFGMAHVLKLTPTYLKQMSLIFTEMFLSRVSAIHLVNCPISESLMGLLKKFISPKISERIMVHDKFENLFNYIPKDVLPKDFGGIYDITLNELNDLWKNKMVEYYQRYEDLAKMRVDEKLRPIPLKNDEFLGYYGNFKKINVD